MLNARAMAAELVPNAFHHDMSPRIEEEWNAVSDLNHVDVRLSESGV